ncbi:MAG: glycosyltransferase, partial [Oligoflexales bacterium]|nr:glycosyltransferase [Oligoflexales bacterium]
VLKFLSDNSDESMMDDFRKSLALFRKKMEEALDFVLETPSPDISVIVPVFNRETTVARCVDSILGQSVKAARVIVVDDGSTDGTSSILKGYADRGKIVLLTKDRNEGVSAARNSGIRAARSQWIAFCDSDDVWERHKLERQWAYVTERPFYEIMQCDEIWIRDGRRVNSCKYHKKSEGFIFEKSLERCMVSPSAVLMRRRLFDDAGLFDEKLPACEDYELWLRITGRFPVGLDGNLSLIKYGGHVDQLSRKYCAMDRFRVYAMARALSNEKSERRKDALRREISSRLEILEQGSRKRGRLGEAETYLSLHREIQAGGAFGELIERMSGGFYEVM